MSFDYIELHSQASPSEVAAIKALRLSLREEATHFKYVETQSYLCCTVQKTQPFALCFDIQHLSHLRLDDLTSYSLVLKIIHFIRYLAIQTGWFFKGNSSERTYCHFASRRVSQKALSQDLTSAKFSCIFLGSQWNHCRHFLLSCLRSSDCTGCQAHYLA